MITKDSVRSVRLEFDFSFLRSTLHRSSTSTTITTTKTDIPSVTTNWSRLQSWCGETAVKILLQRHSVGTLEGRTIEYRPGGGLDYHNSPLMAEIPAGEYSHIHRSIDQLRSGVLQLSPLSGTDIRASLVHDYKPYISDLRHNGDRHDYTNKTNGHDVRSDVGANNNNNAPNDVDINRHNRNEQQQQQTQQDIKSYSSPSTPPTPLSSDGHMNDSKVGFISEYNIYCFFFCILLWN